MINNTPLGTEQFKAALPQNMRKHVTKEVMDGVNMLIVDPSLRETYRENLLSFTMVMDEGNFYSLGKYIEAIKFVSCRLMGHTDLSSWCSTFPERYKHYLGQNVEPNYIDSVVGAYKRGKLVTRILEQTLVPTHILNADLHQKAINKLADLMMNARSEKVQSDSAAKLVDVLKLPETSKIELDVNIKEDSSIKDLRDSTLALVAQQRKMIELGAMSPKEIAHSKIIAVDGDAVVVENAG